MSLYHRLKLRKFRWAIPAIALLHLALGQSTWATSVTSVDGLIQDNLKSASKIRDYESYSQAMDASLLEKIKMMDPWIQVKLGSVLVDVGSGTGSVASFLAKKYPQSFVLGLDLSREMIERSRNSYSQPNLFFHLAEANTLFPVQADVAVYSSILHEIYSYSGDSLDAVQAALKTVYSSLKSGGRVIIRDFVKPSNGEKKVILVHMRSDQITEHTFEQFSRSFSRKVPIKVLENNSTYSAYETNLESAYEFMFRKDYHQNWRAELNEKYGFWTSKEALTQLKRAGFKIIHLEESMNPWIQKNRLDGKVYLLDPENGEILDYPNYQLLVVGEKEGD